MTVETAYFISKVAEERRVNLTIASKKYQNSTFFALFFYFPLMFRWEYGVITLKLPLEKGLF